MMNKIILILTLVLTSFLSVAQFDTSKCTHTIIDTLKYTIHKSNTPTPISINTINESNSAQTDDGYSGFAQLFEAPDSVSVKGFCFYAYMYSGASDSILARLYQTNNNGDLDSLLDSIWVPVPLKANYNGPKYSNEIKICAQFDTTHKLIGDYVISLENRKNSDMYIIRNTNGLQEDLAYAYYYWTSNHQYDGWFKGYSSYGNTWNFDIIIEPIVSYQIKTQHTISQNSKCFGDTLTVSSSLSYNDSLLFNRMYNPNYTTYSPIHSFIYLYGDTTSSTTDTSHIYSIPGSFNALFTGVTNMKGWTYENYVAFCGYNAKAWDFKVNLGPDRSICVDSINLGDIQYFTSYLWNTMDTTDKITLFADSLNAGVYEYSLRAEFQGCYSYDTIDITIGNLPVNLGSDTSLCLNQQLELLTGINGIHSWNTGQLTDSIIVGPFNSAALLSYIVEVEANGCVGTDTINVTIDNCVGLDEQVIAYSIYPNPTSRFLTIESEELINYEIKIIDLNGRIILNEIKNNNKQTIDLSNLENGVYILSISNGNKNIKEFIQIIK